MELNSQEQILFKQLLLETYDAFALFCKENNLRFFAAYGTALGAVRHNGIIPWDDDMDVFMLQEDYNRLLSLKHKLYETDYEILDLGTPNYYCSFAKFASKKNSIWEYRDLPCMFGVYIDVFPLFTVAGEVADIKAPYNAYCSSMNRFRLCSLKRTWSCIGYLLKQRNASKAIYYIMQKFSLPLVRPFYKCKVKKGLISKGKGKVHLVSPFEGADLKRLCYSPDWFEKVVMFPFDGREIPVPAGYDAMLTTTYGDYMTPPPVEQRVTHHAHYYFNLGKRVTIEEARKELKK